jgi:hypothetical protein
LELTMAAAPWTLPPYVPADGRTETRHRLLLHTLVSVPSYDARVAADLTPETRSMYEHARSPRSVAELAALCGLQLGVARVVIDDLVDAGRLQIHADATEDQPEVALLERVRDGLRRLN